MILRKLSSDEEFERKLLEELMKNENFYPKAYLDSYKEGLPTIGIGYALETADGLRKKSEIEEHLKGTGLEISDENYKILKNIREAESRSKKQQILNSFSLVVTKNQAEKIALNEIYSRTKTIRDEILTRTGIDMLVYFKNTEELVSLMSIIYHGSFFDTAKDSIGTEIRSEIWYAIRYTLRRTIRSDGPGLSGRKYKESNAFQLFDFIHFNGRNQLVSAEGKLNKEKRKKLNEEERKEILKTFNGPPAFFGGGHGTDLNENKLINNPFKTKIEHMKWYESIYNVNYNGNNYSAPISEILKFLEGPALSYVVFIPTTDEEKNLLKIQNKELYKFEKRKSEKIDDEKEKEDIDEKDTSSYPEEVYIEPTDDIYIKLGEKFKSETYNQDFIKYVEAKTGRKIEEENKKYIKILLENYENTTIKMKPTLEKFGIGNVVAQEGMDILRDKELSQKGEPIRIQDIVYWMLKTDDLGSESLALKLEKLFKGITAENVGLIVKNNSVSFGELDIDQIKYTIKKESVENYEKLSSYQLHKMFEGELLTKKLLETKEDGTYLYPKAKRFINDLTIEFIKTQVGLGNEKPLDNHKYKDSNILRNFLLKYDHEDIITFPVKTLENGMFKKLYEFGSELSLTKLVTYYMEVLLTKNNDFSNKILQSIHKIMGEYTSNKIINETCKYKLYYDNLDNIEKDKSDIKKIKESQSEFSNYLNDKNSTNIVTFYIELYTKNDDYKPDIYYTNKNAVLECENSKNPGKIVELSTSESSREIINGAPGLIVGDIGIKKSFITCSASKSGKCEVDNILTWTIENKEEHLTEDEKNALMETSTSKCPKYGAAIKIKDPGQDTKADNPAPIDDDDFIDYSTECKFIPITEYKIGEEKLLSYILNRMNEEKYTKQNQKNAYYIRKLLDENKLKEAVESFKESTSSKGVWDYFNSLPGVNLCDAKVEDRTKIARYNELYRLNSLIYGYLGSSIFGKQYLITDNKEFVLDNDKMSEFLIAIASENNQLEKENPRYNLESPLIKRGVELYSRKGGSPTEEDLLESIRTYITKWQDPKGKIADTDCPYYNPFENGKCPKLPVYIINKNTILIKSNGEIIKYTKNNIDSYVYVYQDKSEEYHELGLFKKNKHNLIQLKNFEYKSNLFEIKYKIKSGNEYRSYVREDVLASLFGSLAETDSSDIVIVGFSTIEGNSPSPSKSHINGKNGDFRYLRTDRTGEALYIDTDYIKLDVIRQNELNNALYKFGWKSMLSFKYGPNNSLLNHSIHFEEHHHHLHVQGYEPNFREEKIE